MTNPNIVSISVQSEIENFTTEYHLSVVPLDWIEW